MPTIINKTHLERIQKCQPFKALPTTIDYSSLPWRNLGKINKELSFESYTNCRNLCQIWEHALKSNQNKEIIGVRAVVEVIDDDLISQVKLDHFQCEKVVIFADTRKEWMVTALTCYKFGLPIVTVYSTLGCEAVDYVLSETNGKYLFTSEDQLNKLEVTCDCFCDHGLTRTCVIATLDHPSTREEGTVGIPLDSVEIVLKPWKEGNYFPNNDNPKNLCERVFIKKVVVESTQESICTVLNNYEIPRKIIPSPYISTSSNSLITDAIKIKRKAIEKEYFSEISGVYIQWMTYAILFLI
uniref:long-chain-fatty-acid--CoA ligase n=1 Tax=Strongyloides venezuelensis TaxID=75913 RepID=A0A0K0G3B7_STRVS